MQTPREILDRSLDAGRRRSLRARRRHADRRRAAIAVVVSRCRRGAGQHRRGRTCRRANMEIAQRAVAACRGRHAACRRRMPLRALSARRRQAAGAGLGCHRRDLQNPRPALRAAAHQFHASPRRRLQGPELQAGARRGSGRADAMGRRGVRDRGLCRRRRRRADALARRMVGAAARQGAGRIAADLDRENRRGRAKTLARRRSPARRPARARSVAGDRRPRRGPHARGAWRRCAADLRSRSARDTRGSPSIPAAAS